MNEEILLGVERVPQSFPSRNPGGDCFACAATAGIRFILRDKNITFDSVFDLFKGEYTSGGEYVDNTWTGMKRALERFSELDVSTRIVRPEYETNIWSHGWFAGNTRDPYCREFRFILEAGGLVFTEIDYEGRGPCYVRDGQTYRNHINHFVLLDGLRLVWQDTRYGRFKSSEFEVHVVCSARDSYWVDVSDFLWKYGAAGWIIAKPNSPICDDPQT